MLCLDAWNRSAVSEVVGTRLVGFGSAVLELVYVGYLVRSCRVWLCG
jgi:hypothetical protein